MTPAEGQALIRATCQELEAFLVEKNRKYGNSALEPIRVFSKAGPIEQILVRIDDKVNRWIQGGNEDEDVEHDLLGYFLLLRAARKHAARK